MTDEVMLANNAFYDAHERRDLNAMAAVWEHSDRACCTHPGWPILRTWSVIEESWRRIFAGTGRNQFIVTNEQMQIVGDVAWISLDENLVDGGMTGTIAATNMFVRAGSEWKMILHHGSPVASL